MTEGVSTRMVGDSQGSAGFGFRGGATTGGVEDGEING